MQRRSCRTGELVILSNQQLAQIERSGRAARRLNQSPLPNPNPPSPPPSPTQPEPPMDPPPPPNQPQPPQIPQNPENGFPAELPPELVAHYQAWLHLQGGEMQQMREELQRLRNERQAPPPQQPPQPRGRTIGESDAPHLFYQNQSPIVPPPIARRDYDIKPQLIALVQSKQFHGLPNENPRNHIETFERFCKTTIANGVTYDYIMCMLFPFSLADKGERWLNSLPAGSLRSWSEVRNAFLDYFYTKGKTALLRNKIITFSQAADESFKEAWDRYNEYRRDCPHHGYSDDQILRFYYDGLTFEYRMALDAASNGDFNTQNVEGAFKLLDNMAQSSHKKSTEFDRTIRAPTQVPVVPTSKDALVAQMEELLKLYNTQREVHMVAEDNQPEINGEAENSEEVNYVNGQGYGQNRGYNHNQRNNPLFSWRSNNVANPQDQQYPAPQQNKPFSGNQGYQNQQQQGNWNNTRWTNPHPQGNQAQNTQGFQQRQFNQAPAPQPQVSAERAFFEEFKAMISKGNEEVQNSLKDLNEHIIAANTENNARFATLETRIRMAEMQVAQTAEQVKRQQGTLPGKGETNPRKDVCLVHEDDEQKRPVSEDPEEAEEAEETTTEVVVEKLEDPGKVTLSVQIKEEVFSDCLCDLGSSVNLMSHAAAKNLGITTYEPTNISLRFADRSEKKPLGVLEDVPVILEKVSIPTDFVILELGEESTNSILLGRPFLCTAGAIIDVRKKAINLNLNHAGHSSIRRKIPFDPGAGKLTCSPNDLLRSRVGETSEKRLFEETDVFAGTQKSGPDKSDLDHSSTAQHDAVQADSCTGLGSVTRPPDISQN